jgi:hypothetical protein
MLVLGLAAACSTPPTPTAAPPATPTTAPVIEPAASVTLSPVPASPTLASAPTSSLLADALATTAAGTPVPNSGRTELALKPITSLPHNCLNAPEGLPAEGLRAVAHLATGFCFHGEIGLFEIDGRLYTVQALTDLVGYVAFVIIEVTDPVQPVLVGAWQWTIPTSTVDVKPFRQGDRWFVAVARQGPTDAAELNLCREAAGVALIEVTVPEAPVLLDVITGERVGSRATWCNVHTVSVSTDAEGNAAYLYASSNDTYDLRLVDIHDLANPRETYHYTHPDAGFYNLRNEFFVHDTTVVDDRVYISYWSGGVIVLDRAEFEAGRSALPLNPLDSIDPWGFQVHHAFPIQGGNYLFIEDEYNYGERPQIRLFDIRDLANPREVAGVGDPDRLGSPHNLLVEGDRLFVGSFQDGVRVYDLDTADPDQPVVTPSAFLAVRDRRTNDTVFGSPYDGIWGVRLHACVIDDQPRTCVYASDMSYGLRILVLEP